MEYDGVSWRKISVPNLTVRSIAIDEVGTIYVGGKDEIGFLAPDSKGTLQYMSLLDHLDANKKSFYTEEEHIIRIAQAPRFAKQVIENNIPKHNIKDE